MAKINRSEVTQKAIKELRLDAARERVPTDTSDKIVLTYDLNSHVIDIVKSNFSGASGAFTVYTTPTKQDFYLTDLHLGFTKDATSDNTVTTITGVIGGETVTLARVHVTTTTAGNEKIIHNYSKPIKLDRGTNISVSGTFTAGTYTKFSTIYGFVKD